MRRYIIAIGAVLLLLSGLGSAAASDVLAAQSEALELDELERAAEEYLPDADLEAGISLDEGIQAILDTGSGEIAGVVRKAVRSGVLLLTVVSTAVTTHFRAPAMRLSPSLPTAA